MFIRSENRKRTTGGLSMKSIIQAVFDNDDSTDAYAKKLLCSLKLKQRPPWGLLRYLYNTQERNLRLKAFEICCDYFSEMANGEIKYDELEDEEDHKRLEDIDYDQIPTITHEQQIQIARKANVTEIERQSMEKYQYDQWFNQEALPTLRRILWKQMYMKMKIERVWEIKSIPPEDIAKMIHKGSSYSSHRDNRWKKMIIWNDFLPIFKLINVCASGRWSIDEWNTNWNSLEQKHNLNNIKKIFGYKDPIEKRTKTIEDK
jgi:hypothetical protein